ncbi:hypothetical protein [Polaromonas sp. JS666]|uniref:hypothetical protein n=1 Tax=Polaromonas sp. (strain JS666 / ATCC BAA-500) TaxID=296591 RepID=UPI0000D5B362|nr:hypothetical protein [Polaromonas sp. JS666]ABE42568.1 hypothetical protein Bpro_0608 [Polaromonas sp. JS666]
MRTFTTAFAVLTLQCLLAMFSPAHAQSSSSGTFGVTIVLRTFSEEATADHRCTHRGQAEGQAGTLRISCPATVDVQAIASASTRKTAQYPQNAAAGQADRTQLAVVAGQPMNSLNPIELTISW